MNNIVIIDSSYYNFYRFYATVNWYNFCPERKKLSENTKWIDNPIFMKTFENTWFHNIKIIMKKFNISPNKLIFARDGNNVWRYKFFPHYKGNRIINSNDIHSPGPIFKFINDNFHQRINGCHILKLSQAEADDIIAITVKYIRCCYPNIKINIITGDHDLLQLYEPNHIELFQLKNFKPLTCCDPKLSLMIKILSGDPSDNIPPIFPGCGKKTAEKLYYNPEELSKVLKIHGDKQFQLNSLLIDFNNIPNTIVKDIECLLDTLHFNQ
jgi:5'-3' exonuclease